MHNVRRFLQDASYETSQDARSRAAAEGNLRPEDMIPIYRKRTAIDSSGRETESQIRYVAVTVSMCSVLIRNQYMQVLYCRLHRSIVKIRTGCLGSCNMRYDHRPGLAIQALQVERSKDPLPSWYVALILGGEVDSCLASVKGFYVSLSTDPPNTKIKDWNVTELKVNVDVDAT